MKVRLIKDCFGPNPEFNPALPVNRKSNWPERVVPKGTILDHPDAFYHCRGEDPNAEPFDAEAQENHAEHLAWREEFVKARSEQSAVLELPAEEVEVVVATPPAPEPMKLVLPLQPAADAASEPPAGETASA